MSSMHGAILALLTVLFFLRVLGQALVAFLDLPWLPSMKQWFSGLISYPILLAIQIVMLLIMTKISVDICRSKGFFARRSAGWSRFLVGFSVVYAAAMALRYVLTMILRPEMRWFGGTIPIFFHFVLAGFIFGLGCYHGQDNRT